MSPVTRPPILMIGQVTRDRIWERLDVCPLIVNERNHESYLVMHINYVALTQYFLLEYMPQIAQTHRGLRFSA
jgi:hypothetical protein